MATSIKRYWHQLTTKEFSRLDAENCVAILPVGAIEQHGPHLPVWSDTRIGQGIIDAMVGQAPDSLPFLILPTIAVGRSEEHNTFPGTLSLRADTLRAVCVDLLESVRRAGIRKVVIFNSHGGNPSIIDVAGLEMRRTHQMLIASTIWYQFGLPSEGLFSDYETSYGTHAGEIETSMMLHLAPELVDDAERQQPSSAQAPIYNVWHSGLAWCVAIFFGLQGMLFYSLIAWMAPMLTQGGLAPETAGLVVGGFGIVGIVSSVLVPMLATRRPNQTMLAVGLGLGQLGCALGLFFASGVVAAVFAIAFGLFSTGAFTLCFILFAVRAPTSSVSTALSGMAQSVGYALAAAGPMVLGIAFDMTASWSSAGLAIIAMALGTTCFGFVVGSKVIAAR